MKNEAWRMASSVKSFLCKDLTSTPITQLKKKNKKKTLVSLALQRWKKPIPGTVRERPCLKRGEWLPRMTPKAVPFIHMPLYTYVLLHTHEQYTHTFRKKRVNSLVLNVYLVCLFVYILSLFSSNKSLDFENTSVGSTKEVKVFEIWTSVAQAALEFLIFQRLHLELWL